VDYVLRKLEASFLNQAIQSLYILGRFSLFINICQIQHILFQKENFIKIVYNFGFMDREEKIKLYESVEKDFEKNLHGAKGIIPRMSTLVSVLHDKFSYYFWIGFYFIEEDNLVVGPYQGPSACANIGWEGVCGTSAKKKETVIVPDVHKFPGHIVCDERSKSEIVVPLMKDDELIAVLDIDSDELNSFDEVDKEWLEKLVPIVLDE
jgi:L-methionine (R)-S-oxide reductase